MASRGLEPGAKTNSPANTAPHPERTIQNRQQRGLRTTLVEGTAGLIFTPQHRHSAPNYNDADR
jgi:hypothetical protein